MTRTSVRLVTGLALVAVTYVAGTHAASVTPLTMDSARITISGTSNIHEYTASTTTVHVTRGQLAESVDLQDVWAAALKPGGLAAFEVVIPAASLTSPREGLDKNMHKALRVTEFPDIAFRVERIEPRGDANGVQATGVLRIAGVERELTFDITTVRKGAALAVHGEVPLLMTDFGIKPPVAMMGMLKTNPKVTVVFDAVVAVPMTSH